MFCTHMKGVLQTQQGVRSVHHSSYANYAFSVYNTKYYKLFLCLVVEQL